MNKIYKHYKERLVEISGRSRSLYSKKINKKTAYDIGNILNGDYEAIDDFVDFLWSGKRTSYSVVCKESRERICKNLNIDTKITPQFSDLRPMKTEQAKDENLRRQRINRDEKKKAIIAQVNHLKTLKREIEEFSRETGRYELYVGYPFVEGSIGREMIIRAPLLLFPVNINIENETTAEIELRANEPVQLNKVFAYAYARRFRLNIDELRMEFQSLLGAKIKTIDDMVTYLRTFGFKMQHPERKGIFNFERAKEPHLGDPLEVKHYAVLGRFPLANAIYNDYTALEKLKPTNAINELLNNKNPKRIKNPNTNLFAINALDFAQEEAIEKLNQSGNLVIYGPPGTGKSQTIVNIITDALCKNKRVLVVSQKKAALDVVYNRLGVLNDRAMYIVDPEKNKADFFTHTKDTHLAVLNQKSAQLNYYENQYQDVNDAIKNEVNILRSISDTLFTPTEFGINLQQMYAQCHFFGKESAEHAIYKNVLKNPQIMSLKYNELNDAIRVITEKKKGELYYKRLQMCAGNLLIDHIKNDLDVHTIYTARAFINKLINKRIAPFDLSQYSNARQLVAFYWENSLKQHSDLMPVIRFIAKLEKKKAREVAKNFDTAMESIKKYVEEFSLLETILDKKGFAMTLDNILNGNTLFLKLLLEALDNYVTVRDMNLNLRDLNNTEMLILNFAYENTSNYKDFKEVIEKLVMARIYHELINAEEKYKLQLSKIMEYESTKNRILLLKNEQKEIVKQICIETFKKNYSALYNSNPENKNFFYQISKQHALWPIRKLMEIYEELMLALFPCWLLSPECVSMIMPLKQNLFDLILFDEASQIFIESTLPTIYRGRYIAVAGDSKQLRPTALFMRRYLGTDIDDMNLTTQAALEVESLLDLATSRYSAINLNYHYRSKSEEFISFSNHAFYDGKLLIAPNTTKNSGASAKPIERIKVDGRWLDRKNREEGFEVIRLLKKIFRTRKEKETIGIVTFNAEQENFIEDLIDAECARDANFRNAVLKERNRKEDGEDVSLFVKNLENVQGEERDIIVFSIGYARNEHGKVASMFGPLNNEGGENRLNVAITRAKKKVYVITSVEPEELSVEGTKNSGPKLFKKYLQYVRAVSAGNKKEANIILESLKSKQQFINKKSGLNSVVAVELKQALEELGYTVEANLGDNSYKLSLAIYDKKLDRYLVGIECDDAAYNSSSSVIERDVFRSKFLESRGWKIIRVWSRDWWLSKSKVINSIDKHATRMREKLSCKS